MPRNVYSEIYLHVVWRTKDNAPLINGLVEPELYKFIRSRALESEGVFVYAVGGTEDHVHLCVSVPPTVLISEWVGALKGASSHHINHKVRDHGLYWPTGYGVISFGKNNLSFVQEYIENQKTHHAQAKLHDRLERIRAEDEDGLKPDSEAR